MEQLKLLKAKLPMRQYLSTILSWLLNSGLFYLGWVLTIKFILQDKYWQGPVINLAIILLHIARVPNRMFETVLILSLAMLGSVVDTALAYFNIIQYEGQYLCCTWFAPAWITSLWALFATSINHSLVWVGKTVWMSILVGSIGGTVSYLTAIKVGAAYFLVPEWQGIMILAIVWAIAMPLCFVINDLLKKWFNVKEIPV
ncbi:MAG: DUF2878 domain-containing protein [Parachlamydiales bacterium]|jgi:hypothetical protein